jgi:hypothetical protein
MTTITVEALISRDAHTITNIPSVPSLKLRVATTTINRATFAVVVPGNGQATLDVSGGDVVEIVASNQVCVAPDRCHGPDGDPRQPGMSGVGADRVLPRSADRGRIQLGAARLAGRHCIESSSIHRTSTDGLRAEFGDTADVCE